MDHYRAFVGLALPESYQTALAALRERVSARLGGGLSWTRPGNWHLTLKFLGDVPDNGPGGLDRIREALAGVVFSSFVLAGQGGGFFPHARRPRVAWIGLGQGREACTRLAGAVEAALAPLGYPAGDRPFAAHLTVARVRDPGRAGDMAVLERELGAMALPAVTVTDFTLWRSELGPGGPRYTVLDTVPAAGDGV